MKTPTIEQLDREILDTRQEIETGQRDLAQLEAQRRELARGRVVLPPTVREQILGALAFASGPLSPAEISRAIYAKPETVQVVICQMMQAGTIDRVGRGRYCRVVVQ